MNQLSSWKIDPSHSEIAFKVKHLMISNVRGRFSNFTGTVNVSNNDFSTSEIELSIKTASVNTGDSQRDEHLKSADFFDASTFPEINFVVRSIQKTSREGMYNVIGDLSIRDITNEVALEVEFGGLMNDPSGNQKAGFSVHGKIKRHDWGLTWNTKLETGGLLVGEDISIICEIQLLKNKVETLGIQAEVTATEQPATDLEEIISEDNKEDI